MPKVKTKNKSDDFSIIEYHLRNYHHYKSGIRNMKKQLEFIMPPITPSYQLRENALTTFSFNSTTENYALERIESHRAAKLHEDIAVYQLIIESIDDAIESLDELEKQFVRCRYFLNLSMDEVKNETKYSISKVFNVRSDLKDKFMISLRHIINLKAY
jgi:hypothetical protein